MDHFFHIFGGGCGEHMVWPWLASAGVGLTMARNYIRAQVLAFPQRFRRD